MKRKESGITLLSLCVALIVMIILAGIALRLSIGDNGIVGITTNTVDQYTNATDQEQEGLNRFVDEFNSIINGGGTGNEGPGGEDVTIADRPTIDIVDWSRTGGIVEISTLAGYTTQYRIGRTGPWQNYTGQVDVDNGETIYARYKDDTGVSQTVSQIVEDTNGPDVTLVDLAVNGGEITIQVTAVDNEMGMPEPPTYNFYIKPTTETYFESMGHSTTGEFTFTGLQGNTAYDIRVSTTDLAGNQGSLTVNSETGSIVEIPELVPDGPNQNIFFELDPSGPTKGNVDVTIRVQPQLQDPLYLEYRVNEDGEWLKYNGPVEMTDNGTVYARVTDGTEYSNVVSVDVTNIDRDKPNVDVEVTDQTSDSITVEVVPKDPSNPDKDQDDFEYDYYIKESGEPDSEYEKDNGENNQDDTHIFDGLEQGKDYDIKVEVTDPAGNTTVIIIPGVTTEEVPSGNIEGNITITPNPTTPTNQEVTVTITGKYTDQYSIQYSIDNGNPQNYTGPFRVSQNCTITAWYTDGTNIGSPATLQIENIDTEAPIGVANPSNADSENDSHQVTVNLTFTDQGTAGFEQNQGIQYAWTTQTSGTVSEGLTSLPGTNAYRAGEIKFTVQSPDNLTGTYYLYVQAIRDAATNSSENFFFGPYNFDNTAPTPSFEPNGSTDYNKHYDVDLTFPEDEKNDVSKIEYEWTQGEGTPPTFPEGTPTVGVDDTIPSPDGVTGDDWYLNVKVTDNNGNETTVKVGPFYIDNSGPEVDFEGGPFNEYKQSHTVTVNVDDKNVGTEGKTPIYYWVDGTDEPSDDDIKGNGTPFNSGDSIKTPNTTSDELYLWIYAEDELGNLTKEKVGPFYVDVTPPIATFEPNGSTTWKQIHEVTVNPTDVNSQINEGTLKYQWTQSSQPPSKESFDTNGQTFSPNGTIMNPDNYTGNNWYLWIYVEDNAGNGNIIGTSNPFYIDNSAPELSLSVKGTESSNSINIEATATDVGSGVDGTSYKYYIKETNGGNYGEAVSDGTTHNFTGLKAETSYTIKVEVTDIAGNTTEKDITVTTGSVATGDTVITHTIQPEGWTNGNVTLTLSLTTGYEDYKIQYQLPGGGWTDYSSALTISSNQTIKVRPLDASRNPGSESSINITNIDKVAPTISASPASEETPSKTKTITVTATDTNADDNVAGFEAGRTIKYGWSQSSTQAPAYDQTATSSNGANARTASFSIITPNVTGTYYLWVQADSLQDQADNSNAVAHFGPYVLDNQGPSIQISPNEASNWAKTHATTITSADAAEITYVWKLATAGEPTDQEYTGTTNSEEEITKNSGSGEYILYVKAKDSLGNETKSQSGIFRFDNTAPVVTFGTNGNSTAQNEHSTTVSISDDGFSTVNTLKYLWSQAETGINENSFATVQDTFVSGENITRRGENGNWYLWILAKDEAENTVVTKTQNPFVFDSTNPTITFNPQSNSTYAKEQKVQVSVEDTNLDETSLRYLWTANTSTPSSAQITGEFSNNGEITINEGTGARYLWILARDTAGNEVILNGGPYLLDNTAPSVQLSNDGTTNSITVNVDATDNESGIRTYSYTLREVNEDGGYGDEQTVTDGNTHTFSNLPANTTYEVEVTVTDNAGNSTTRKLEGIITGTVPGGSANLEISWDTDWTNQPVTVTITNNATNPQNYTVQYKVGNESYTNYDTPFTVQQNTTVNARLVDISGNEGSPAVADIANIDTGKPGVTASPAQENTSTKTKQVTVTARDTNYDVNIAGFKANQTLKYAWSTSASTAPESFENATASYDEGDTEITFNINGTGLTGRYYLWVQAGCLTDQAENSNDVAHFGPYVFDNTAPTPTFDPNGNATWLNEQSTTVTVDDTNATLRYLWTQSNTSTPQANQFTTSFNSGDTLRKSTDSGIWYLWIYAEDATQNSRTICSNAFYLDNELPTISFEEEGDSTASTTKSVVVTVTDSYSGVNDSSLKYLWSPNDTQPQESEFTNDFTNGQSIEGTGLNGTYYLWILAKDNTGNTRIEKTDATFNFDTQAPTVTFNPERNNTWAQQQSSTVTVTDTNSNVDESSLKYQWLTTTSRPTEQSFTNTFTNNEQIVNNTDTGKYYLWILAKDNLGNTIIDRSDDTFWLDNTDPNLELIDAGLTTTESITIRANATDTDSNINTSSYRYYIKQGTGPYGEAITDGSSHTFSGLTADTEYTIRVEVSDNAENTTSREIGPIKTNPVPSGETAITYTLQPNSWTNTNVLVTIQKADEYGDYTLQYSTVSQSSGWTNYQNAFEVSTNGNIYAKLVDSAGNSGNITTIPVTIIDKEKPTISATRTSDETPSKAKTVILTVNDQGPSGFAANKTIRYGWTTANNTAPTSYSEVSATNAEGASNATFTITSENELTGSYYLWINAGSIADRATNTNDQFVTGPYVFDNTAPEVIFGTNGGENWAKTHSTTVTADDATTIKYVWTQSTTEPEDDEFVTEIDSGDTVEKSTDSGEWYLWVYVEDEYGNTGKYHSNVFRFDNTAPVITFDKEGDSTPRKNHEVAPTVEPDGMSAIDDSSLKYIWTTSTDITEGSFDSVSDTFTSGEAVMGSGYSGEYYLWVIAKDEVGNVAVKRTNSTFKFDNTAPTATFDPNGSAGALTNAPSVEVTVSDDNPIDESSLIYYWSMNDYTSYDDIESVGTPFTNGQTIIYDGDEDSTVETSHKLYIGVKDTAGNEAIIISNGFIIDVTAPIIRGLIDDNSENIKSEINSNSATLSFEAYDYFWWKNETPTNTNFKAIIKEKNGDYSKEENATNVANSAQIDNGTVATFEFTDLTSNTEYEVTVTATDAVGNVSEPYIYNFVTSEIPAADTSITARLDPNTWTNQSVKVTLSTTHIGYTIVYRTGTSTGDYTDYSSDTGIVLTQNDVVYAKLKDSTGNLSTDVKTIDVSNIDTQSPTISANVEYDSSSDWSKQKQIELTVTDSNTDDSIAGFAENATISYSWSNSSSTPGEYKTATSTNVAGATEIKFDITSDENLSSGLWFLWIQGDYLTDRAGNALQERIFGSYHIDNDGPTLSGDGQISVTDRTSKSITISVPSITDTGSGVPTSPQYTYYIKKSTDPSFGAAKGTTTSQTFIFNDLDDNTNYNIQVTFADNAGNVGTASTTAQTVLVPALNSSNTTFTVYKSDGTQLADNKVTNEAVTVAISVNSGTQANYTLQYRIGSTGDWEDYTDRITVNENTTIYARLWDQRNDNENVGTETTKTISNIDTSLSDLGVLITNKEEVPINTPVTDSEDNPITIPEGFTPKPSPDGTDPNDPTVDEGVIIEDGEGNQFVWIPVGEITTRSGSKVTINYDRYAFSNWYKNGTDTTTNQAQIKTTSNESEYFTEQLNSSEKNSAEINGGFYLGRYEAGVSSTSARTASSGTSDTVLSQANKNVYNYVTQSEARSLAENMYSSSSFTSNLTSSYAWDTALEFLNLTGNSSYLTNSSQGNYYNTQYGGKTETDASTLIETGQTTAVKHLYDMGGNVYEWTTERYSSAEATKVSRGGFYGFTSTDEPVIGRFSSSNTADQAVGFRVALFLGAVDDQVRYMDDLQVGDYVAYTPDSAGPYTGLTQANTGSSTTTDDSFTQESLSWRVLSINDDGTVDLISSAPTSQSIYFSGSLGYNNGVYLLNDVASSLYSNASLGATARSLTIEDIEAGMTEAGLEYVHSYAAVGETKTYTRSGYRYYPNIYAQENGSGIDLATTNDPNSAVKTDGIGQSDSYYTEPTTETYTQASSSLTVTQTYYDRSMNSSYYKNSTFYNLVHSGNTY